MIHPNQFRLFGGKRLDGQFRERRQQLHDTVELLPAKDLKDQTIDENVQSIMSVLEFKPITFSLGSIEHQVVREYITAEDHPKTKFFTDDPRWFGSERDVIVFRVPFQGNTELLWSTPTHFSGRRTDVYVEHPYLCFREIA